MPVVLIHAFPLSSEMWAHERNALARSFMVVTPDLPGFGKSSRQKAPSIPEIAKEVAQLLDHLELEKVFIGGLSMGGYVTFEFFRQFPEKVQALGLFSTRAAADTPKNREKRFKTIEAIQKDGIKPFAGKVIENLLGKTTREAHPDIVQQVKAMILAASPEGVTGALRAMAERRDNADLLTAISCPTLVIAGDEDSFIPLEETKIMQKKIAGSTFHALAKTGHLANLEQPTAFLNILEGFLKKL